MKKYYLFWYGYEVADMLTIQEIEREIVNNSLYGRLKKNRAKKFEAMKSKGIFDDKNAFVRLQDVQHITKRST